MQPAGIPNPAKLVATHRCGGSTTLNTAASGAIAGRTRRNETVRPNTRTPAPVRAFTMPATGLAREKIVREAAAVDDDELRALIAKVRIDNDK